MWSMPGSLKSSMNLPQPRTRRDSSLRTMGRPTHPFFLPSGAGLTAGFGRGNVPGTRFAVDGIFLATIRSRRVRYTGVECFLQPIDELLNVLLGERLQQPARHGDDAPKHLRLALPRD